MTGFMEFLPLTPDTGKASKPAELEMLVKAPLGLRNYSEVPYWENLSR
jgi:hypothetical protein